MAFPLELSGFPPVEPEGSPEKDERLSGCRWRW